MTKPLITIHNTQTNEVETREMNDAEYADYVAVQEANAAKQVEAEEKAEAKQAVLDKLGLTAEEVTALLG